MAAQPVFEEIRGQATQVDALIRPICDGVSKSGVVLKQNKDGVVTVGMPKPLETVRDVIASLKRTNPDLVRNLTEGTFLKGNTGNVVTGAYNTSRLPPEFTEATFTFAALALSKATEEEIHHAARSLVGSAVDANINAQKETNGKNSAAFNNALSEITEEITQLNIKGIRTKEELAELERVVRDEEAVVAREVTPFGDIIGKFSANQKQVMGLHEVVKAIPPYKQTGVFGLGKIVPNEIFSTTIDESINGGIALELHQYDNAALTAKQTTEIFQSIAEKTITSIVKDDVSDTRLCDAIIRISGAYGDTYDVDSLVKKIAKSDLDTRQQILRTVLSRVITTYAITNYGELTNASKKDFSTIPWLDKAMGEYLPLFRKEFFNAIENKRHPDLNGKRARLDAKQKENEATEAAKNIKTSESDKLKHDIAICGERESVLEAQRAQEKEVLVGKLSNDVMQTRNGSDKFTQEIAEGLGKALEGTGITDFIKAITEGLTHNPALQKIIALKALNNGNYSSDSVRYPGGDRYDEITQSSSVVEWFIQQSLSAGVAIQAIDRTSLAQTNWKNRDAIANGEPAEIAYKLFSDLLADKSSTRCVMFRPDLFAGMSGGDFYPGNEVTAPKEYKIKKMPDGSIQFSTIAINPQTNEKIKFSDKRGEGLFSVDIHTNPPSIKRIAEGGKLEEIDLRNFYMITGLIAGGLASSSSPSLRADIMANNYFLFPKSASES